MFGDNLKGQLAPFIVPGNENQVQGIIDDYIVSEVKLKAEKVIVRAENDASIYRQLKAEYEAKMATVHDQVADKIREGLAADYDKKIASLRAEIATLTPDAEFGRMARKTLQPIVDEMRGPENE